MTETQYLDMEDFKNRVGDDIELIMEIFQLYLDDAEKLMTKITLAANKNDIPALKKSAHAMKGTSASISAKAVQERAYELERLCLDEDLSNVGEIIDGLRQAYEITIVKIRQNIENPELIQGSGSTEV
jgi:HPt (histidine-containing phosphotransfer) domain-containing protein